MINEPRELHEPIGKAGMQQLATDVYNFLKSPRKSVKFNFYDATKIVITVLILIAIAYGGWWIVTNLLTAFGRAWA
jgi:hypothetical protein